MPERLLLHICCGPCTIYPLALLREEGFDVDGFFYNPNIHPFTEYQRRRDALLSFAYGCALAVQEEREDGPGSFLRAMALHEGDRCLACYTVRLRRTVAAAVQGGYGSFTTTLLFSRYQKHDLIREIAKELALEWGITFIYRDFREGWKQGTAASKAMGMYRQNYCG
ncbi:MAG: epoxyqueuosine reductase QueH, partial [Syntrophales bacterium]|nr:epoxyqueuosine reductase QueH [Syntrophales bacterium]